MHRIDTAQWSNTDSKPSSSRMSVRLSAVFIALFIVCIPGIAPAATPQCPGTDASKAILAAAGTEPSVTLWHDLATLPADCHVVLDKPAKMILELTSVFSYSGPVEGLAARIGSISASHGLPYWSVNDEKWRELISDASALKDDDEESLRNDFTAEEVLSGNTLFYFQNDTRSWGDNVYSLRKISSSAEHIIVESKNLSSVGVGPVKLFKRGDAHNIVFLHKRDATTWQYYGLTVIKDSGFDVREKSLINRQAAVLRMFVGDKPDKEPPLAK